MPLLSLAIFFDTGSPPGYAGAFITVSSLVHMGCVIWWCWPVIMIPSRHAKRVTRHTGVSQYNRDRQRGLCAAALLHRRVLRAPYCAHSLLRPRDIITSRAGLSGGETATASSYVADYYQQQYQEACLLRGRRKAAGYRDGTFNHRRRQQKRCGSRHFISVAGCLFRRSISPADYIALGHHRAQCVGGTSISAIAARPCALSFDECGKSNACIW